MSRELQTKIQKDLLDAARGVRRAMEAAIQENPEILEQYSVDEACIYKGYRYRVWSVGVVVEIRYLRDPDVKVRKHG